MMNEKREILNKTIPVYLKIRGHIDENNGIKYGHHDIHVGNMLYEMYLKLSPEEIDIASATLSKYKIKKEEEIAKNSRK